MVNAQLKLDTTTLPWCLSLYLARVVPNPGTVMLDKLATKCGPPSLQAQQSGRGQKSPPVLTINNWAWLTKASGVFFRRNGRRFVWRKSLGRAPMVVRINSFGRRDKRSVI